jgi:hypothetical protein
MQVQSLQLSKAVLHAVLHAACSFTCSFACSMQFYMQFCMQHAVLHAVSRPVSQTSFANVNKPLQTKYIIDTKLTTKSTLAIKTFSLKL